MHYSKQAHWTAIVLGAVLIVGGSAAPVTAAQDPGTPSRSGPSISTRSCLLMRVGDQYVRCDNLTGGGVRAASWIPEQ